MQLGKIGTFGCLFFVCSMVYATGLSSPFLLDDFANIPQAVSSGFHDLLFRAMTNDSGVLPRAIPQLSFAMQSLVSLGSYLSHSLNLVLHLLTGWVVYSFAKRVHKPSAVLVCAIFLLHPLFVSTVLYGVGRITQFVTLFMLLTLINYIDWREGKAHGFWVCFYFVLALLSKENAVVVLPIMWLWEYLHNNKNHLPILGLLIAGALIGFSSMLEPGEYIRHGFGPIERLWLEGGAMLHYLDWIVKPWFSNLTFYHDNLINMSDVWCATGWVTMAALTAIVFASKIPVVVRFGVGLYLIGHSLEASIVPLEIAFEHRNYFPAIGLFIALSYYLHCYRASIVIPVVLATLTFVRVDGFANGFASESLANAPNSARAYLALAKDQQPEVAFGLAEMAKEHTFDQAGVTFYQWQLLCERLHPKRIQEGLENSKGIITAFGASSISGYLSAVAAGQCPIDASTLSELETNLENNPTVADNARTLLNWRLAQAWGHLGEIDRMHTSFGRALFSKNSQFVWLNYLQTLYSLNDPDFEKMLESYQSRFWIAPSAKYIKEDDANPDNSSTQ